MPRQIRWIKEDDPDDTYSLEWEESGIPGSRRMVIRGEDLRKAAEIARSGKIESFQCKDIQEQGVVISIEKNGVKFSSVWGRGQPQSLTIPYADLAHVPVFTGNIIWPPLNRDRSGRLELK